MTTQEEIKIMQAFVDGKTIEFASKNENDWREAVCPAWNWYEFDYRIKPEKKYRPYKNADEMIEDWKARFDAKDWPSYSMPLIWIRLKSTNTTYLIYGYQSDWVAIGIARPSFLGVLEDYTYLDGSPCGKEITE